MAIDDCNDPVDSTRVVFRRRKDIGRQPCAFSFVEKHQVRPAGTWGDGGQDLARVYLGPPDVVQEDGGEDHGGVGVRVEV